MEGGVLTIMLNGKSREQCCKLPVTMTRNKRVHMNKTLRGLGKKEKKK